MQFKPLGKTDLLVSNICLGTMTWGEQNTQNEAFAQMDYALARGVNFFDAAEMYPVPPKPETQGLTETYIGNWFKQNKQRDKVILASKVAGPGMEHIRGGSQLNAEHISQAIEASLKRLQTDYIDLYQIHWPARNANFFGKLGYQATNEEQVTDGLRDVLQSINKLIKSGQIRHYGLSNETPWGAMKYLQLAQELNMPAPVSIQNPYNLLNRTYEVGLAEVSHREQMGLLAYSPLAFGVLTGKYLNRQQPENARLTLFDRFVRYSSQVAEQAVQEYVKVAESFALSPVHLALAFINQQGFVTSNIIGATNVEQLEENINCTAVMLNDDCLTAINQIHAKMPNPCP